MQFLKKVNFNTNRKEAEKFCKFSFDVIPKTLEKQLKFSGWVIGIKSQAVSLELIQDARLITKVPVTIHRPRAAKRYANLPGAEQSGFVVNIDLDNSKKKSRKILIKAVLKNSQKVTLATLTLSQNVGKKQNLLVKPSKVFGIGLAKTGTTSLTKAMKILGYKSKHYILNPNIDRVIQNYDFLNDMPFQTRYKEYDKKYPGSKFILTIRDKPSWQRSCSNQFGKQVREKGSLPYQYWVEQFGFYGYDEEAFSRTYDQHIEEVKAYFKGRDEDLLILDLCGGEGWEKLCPFLGREIPPVAFPQEHVSLAKTALPPESEPQGPSIKQQLALLKTIQSSKGYDAILSNVTTQRVGIGVVTYNRLEHLKGCIASIQKYTKSPYYLVIADDGSTDGTVEWCRSQGLAVITGRNRGVCWNKNRALYALKEYTDADCMILLEDDCWPSQEAWELAWLQTTAIWHHVNYAAPWILQQHQNAIFHHGENPISPYFLKLITGQCTTSSRHALNCVGYLDSRFRGYGFGHTEWTKRCMRCSSIINAMPVPIHGIYPAINTGLTAQQSKSYSNKAERQKNSRVLKSLTDAPIYRFPWQNEQEKSAFLQEASSVEQILLKQVAQANSKLWHQKPQQWSQLLTAPTVTPLSEEEPLPTPRMSEAEIKLFEKSLKGQKVVVEFGVGGSTALAIKAGVQKLYSVESDLEFIKKLQQHPAVQKAVEKGQVQFFHANIGPVRGWGYPQDKTNQEKWPSYYSDVWQNVNDPIDVVFIDGRFRVACALQSLAYIHKTTQVIFHDFWDRPSYHDVLKFFDPIESADTLVVLKAKEEIDQDLLSALREKYQYIAS